MRLLFVLVIFLAIFAMVLEAKKNAPQEPPGRSKGFMGLKKGLRNLT